MARTAAPEKSASASGSKQSPSYMPGPELAVIIPTFNEAANVEPLVSRLKSVLANIRWEAIFVDDDSTDDTSALVRSIAKRDSRVRIITRIGRQGLASAVVEGMLSTSSRYLAVIDGDMQHDESLLPSMIETLRAGDCDIAIGSRYIESGSVGEWSRKRQTASNLATRVSHLLLPANVSDPMSGFFMIKREAFENAVRNLSATGYKILLDILVSSPRKLVIRELPYRFRERRAGESKLDFSVLMEFGVMILDKKFGHIVPPRFIMFSVIGGFGLVVHIGMLWLGLRSFNLEFASSQAFATLVAMTSNYALNNAVTFREKRRSGTRFFTGLLSFYLVCSVGAVANVGIAQIIYSNDAGWWISGVAGALVGSVWNFAASSIFTWRR